MSKDGKTETNGTNEQPNPPTADGPIDAKAEQARRLDSAAINGVLARKRCGRCATAGAWKVYDRDRKNPKILYVKCRGCGSNDKAVLP